MSTTDVRGPGDASAPPPETDVPVDVDAQDASVDVFDVFDELVDPRMRERWIAVRRAEGRRRLRIVAGLVAFVSVAAIAYVVAHSSLLGVGTVEIRGVPGPDAEAVRSAARVVEGSPLLFLDTAAIERRVERLPAVDHADVTTSLPSTVTIRVTRRTPIAWARAVGTPPIAVLDAEGHVLERVAVPPPGLMQVSGVTAGVSGTRVPHARALTVLGRLPERLRAMGRRLGFGPDGAPVLVLRADAVAQRVALGDDTAVARKARVALAVIDTLTAAGEHVRVIGVDVPDAPWTRA